MGYYTDYTLEIVYGDNLVTNYKKEIGEISDYGNPFDDSCKWHDHEEHMREYSKRHPHTLFKLIGSGEEKEDMWHKYFLNGKMQEVKAKIYYEDFNVNKLI